MPPRGLSPAPEHGDVGGNLLQATRCWYWRLAYPCYLHGGDRCHAREGEHREHAIFANEPCASAHPSDPAAALLALGRPWRRRAPVSARRALPAPDGRRPEPDDARAGRAHPRARPRAPDASIYLKAMDRRRYSFALVGVAAARFGTDAARARRRGADPLRLSTATIWTRRRPCPGTSTSSRSHARWSAARSTPSSRAMSRGQTPGRGLKRTCAYFARNRAGHARSR